jgi:DNA-binding NtrC family response regulator
MKVRSVRANPIALVVHPEVAVLAAYQTALAKAGFTPIIARDLPTALLAITQHYLDVAIISSRIGEQGDGWPLGGVVRQAFPGAYVAVLAPETSVRTLQAAINNGLNQLYESSVPPDEVVTSVMTALRITPASPKRPRSALTVQ